MFKNICAKTPELRIDVLIVQKYFHEKGTYRSHYKPKEIKDKALLK